MDQDVTLLQLRQQGVSIDPTITSVSQLDVDTLYAVVRSALPQGGFALNDAEVAKKFPTKLPATSASAKYYVLDTLDQLLKKGPAAARRASREGRIKKAVKDSDDDEAHVREVGGEEDLFSSCSDDGGESGKGRDEDLEWAHEGEGCPSTTEVLMYPAEATTKALLSWLASAVAKERDRVERLKKRRQAKMRGEDASATGLQARTAESLVFRSLLQLRRAVTTVVDHNTAHSKQVRQQVAAAAVAQQTKDAPVPAPIPPSAKFVALSRTRRNFSKSSSGGGKLIPITPTVVTGPISEEISCAGGSDALVEISSINKQIGATFGATKVNVVEAMRFALAQNFMASNPCTVANAPGQVVVTPSSILANNRISSTVSAAHKHDKKGMKPPQFLSTLDELAVLFNSSADGLDLVTRGGAQQDDDAEAAEEAAREAMRLKQQMKDADAAEEAGKALEDIEQKAKSAQQRAQEREAELVALQDRLAAAKKEAKELRKRRAEQQQILDDARAKMEEELADREGNSEDLIARREALAQLQEQLSWMENYDDSKSSLEAQLGEAKELLRQIQEDLNAKLVKMEAKKEDLKRQVSEAGDGREERLMELRRQTKALKKQIKAKVKEINDLREEFDRVPKDIDRSLFLRMIFDLSSNVERQQAEVDRFKRDIFTQCSEIADKSTKLVMLFSELEEMVYEKASATKGKDSTIPGDVFAKESFKSIVAIREAYSMLRTAVNLQGEVRHELHSLEEKSSKAERLVAVQKKRDVVADLAQVEEENQDLAVQLEALLDDGENAEGQGEGEEDEDVAEGASHHVDPEEDA